MVYIYIAIILLALAAVSYFGLKTGEGATVEDDGDKLLALKVLKPGDKNEKKDIQKSSEGFLKKISAKKKNKKQ